MIDFFKIIIFLNFTFVKENHKLQFHDGLKIKFSVIINNAKKNNKRLTPGILLFLETVA